MRPALDTQQPLLVRKTNAAEQRMPRPLCVRRMTTHATKGRCCLFKHVLFSCLLFVLYDDADFTFAALAVGMPGSRKSQGVI